MGKERFSQLLFVLFFLLQSVSVSHAEEEISVFIKPEATLTLTSPLADVSKADRTDYRIAFTELATGKRWILRPRLVAPNKLQVKARAYFPEGSYEIALWKYSTRSNVASFSARITSEQSPFVESTRVSATRGEHLEFGTLPPSIRTADQLLVKLNARDLPFTLTDHSSVAIDIPLDEKLSSRAVLEVFLKQPSLEVLLLTSSFAVEDVRTPFLTIENPPAPSLPGIVSIVVPKIPEVKGMVESKVQLHIRPGAKLPEQVDVYSDGKLAHVIRRDPKTGKREIRDANSGEGIDIIPKKEQGIAEVEAVIPDALGNFVHEPLFTVDLKAIEPELVLPQPSPTPSPSPSLGIGEIVPKVQLHAQTCFDEPIKGDPLTKAAFEIQRMSSGSSWDNLFHQPIELPLDYDQAKGVYVGEFPTLYNTAVDWVGFSPTASVVRANLGNLEEATNFVCDWGGLLSAVGGVKKITDAQRTVELLESHLSKYLRNDSFDKMWAGVMRGAIYAGKNDVEYLKRSGLFDLIHETFTKIASLSGDSVDHTIASWLEDSTFILKEEANCQLSPNPINCSVRPFMKFLRGSREIAVSGLLRDPVGIVCAPLKFKYDLNDKESGFWGSLRSITAPSQYKFDKFTISPVLYRAGDRVVLNKQSRSLAPVYSYPLKRRETGYSDRWLHEASFSLTDTDTACPRISAKNVSWDPRTPAEFSLYVPTALKAKLNSVIVTNGFGVRTSDEAIFPDFVGTREISLVTSYKPERPGFEIEVGLRSRSFDNQSDETDTAILTDRLPVTKCKISRSSRNELVEFSCGEAHGFYVEYEWELDNGVEQSSLPFAIGDFSSAGSHGPLMGLRGSGVHDFENSYAGYWFVEIPDSLETIRACYSPNYYGPPSPLSLKVKAYLDDEIVFSGEHTFHVGDNPDCSGNGGWKVQIPTGGKSSWIPE